MNNERNYSGILPERKKLFKLGEKWSMDNELFHPCGMVEKPFK